MDQKGLGVLLRKRRKELLLTATLAAEKIGISVAALYAIESGERNPTYETLARIIEAYLMDARELFAQSNDYVESVARGFFHMCSCFGINDLGQKAELLKLLHKHGARVEPLMRAAHILGCRPSILFPGCLAALAQDARDAADEA